MDSPFIGFRFGSQRLRDISGLRVASGADKMPIKYFAGVIPAIEVLALTGIADRVAVLKGDKSVGFG